MAQADTGARNGALMLGRWAHAEGVCALYPTADVLHIEPPVQHLQIFGEQRDEHDPACEGKGRDAGQD